MTETNLFRRTLDRMFNPQPATWADKAFEDALATIAEQRETIETQRAHIKALDERIERLQCEAGGLRDLLW